MAVLMAASVGRGCVSFMALAFGIEQRHGRVAQFVRAVVQKLRAAVIDPRMAAKSVACGQHAGAQGRGVGAAVPCPAASAIARAGADHRQGEQTGWAGDVQRDVRCFFDGARLVALPIDQLDG